MQSEKQLSSSVLHNSVQDESRADLEPQANSAPFKRSCSPPPTKVRTDYHKSKKVFHVETMLVGLLKNVQE